MESSLYTIFHHSHLCLVYVGGTRKVPCMPSSTTLISIYLHLSVKAKMLLFAISFSIFGCFNKVRVDLGNNHMIYV